MHGALGGHAPLVHAAVPPCRRAAVPFPALAAWTAPTTVCALTPGSHAAQAAFGGSVLAGDTSRNGLWPSPAMAPGGGAIAAWVTNTDRSGGSATRVALDHVTG